MSLLAIEGTICIVGGTNSVGARNGVAAFIVDSDLPSREPIEFECEMNL